MPLDTLATLRDLVATPSVNPMGRPAAGPEFYEHRVTDYLEALFKRLGMPTWRQPVAPLRENILARLDGHPPGLEQGGALLLIEAHQDTVPVDGMTIPPFDPQVRDGRLYGRGSCDNKGGMTAMLTALARLADERPTPRPTVVMACTVNEEHGFTGAAALARLWSAEANPPALPSSRAQAEGSSVEGSLVEGRHPDAAVIAEPTSLQVVSAHKGMVRWRCHTHGRAAHSSQPQQGASAIFRMARVLAALERYGRDPGAPGLSEHPLCGRPTLSVGTIAGGLSVNTVPDRCTIEIDRRLIPGEDPLVAQRHVIDFLATALSPSPSQGEACSELSRAGRGEGNAPSPLAARGELGRAGEGWGEGYWIQHDPPFLQSPGLGDSGNRALADRLAAAVAAVTGKRPPILGVPFGTNAPLIAASGVPCVVFGPGSIAQAHTADEWVPLAEVEQAADVLYRLIADWPTL